MQLAEEFITIMPIFMNLTFILLLFSIIINKNTFKNLFKNIKKSTWIILFAIFLFNLILFNNLVPHIHLDIGNEIDYLELGKNLLFSNRAFLTLNDVENSIIFPYLPLGWSFVISLFFMFFGITADVAFVTSTIITSSCTILIFLFSYLLFKKESTALFSSFIFLLVVPIIIYSGTTQPNAPSLFFILLMFIGFLTYIKKQKIRTQIFAFSSLAYLIQVRQEFIIFIPFMVFSYLIFKFPIKLKNYKNKEFLLICFIFLILIIPQILQINEKITTDITTKERGGYFNRNYFLFNWNNLIKPILFTGEFHPFLINIFALVGLLTIFKDDIRIGLFLISFFIVFTMFFLMVRELHLRMVLPIYITPIILCGYGVSKIVEFFDKKFNKQKRKFIILSIIVIIIFLFLLSFFSFKKKIYYNYDTSHEINKKYFSFITLETEIEKNLSSKNIIPEDCYVIAAKPGVLEFIPSMKTIEIKELKQKKEILSQLLEDGKCVMFFEDICCFLDMTMCQSSIEYCEYLHNNYNLETFLEYNYENSKFKFYNISNLEN